MTKVKNFLSLLLLMLWVLPTTLEAEERFYIESLNIQPGQTKTFSLNLDNENSYQGFQADIVLPEGLSIVTKTNGTFDISLTDRAPSSFSLSSNEITEGTVRVVCYSSQNDVFSGQSGALVTMQIKASDSFNGGQLSLKNVIFSGLDNRDVNMSDYNLQILSVEKNSLSVRDCSLSAGQGMSIPVMLDNDTEFTAFQFDISVPDGITIDLSKSSVTSRCTSGHQLSTKDLGNGTYRFLCMSMNNDALVGNHGAFLNLWVQTANGAKGEQTVTFNNVVFSDLNAKSYSLAPVSFKVNVQYIAVTAVSISESSKSLYVGDTFQLKATAKPDNCSDKSIVWESSNTNIAAVDDNGNVTAKASGSCNIIAYSGDRSVQASCALTIEKIALTAKVQNASKVYGDENPSFAITYNGFKDGDSEANFSCKPSFTTTADAKSPVGDYEVSASGDISEKYSVTYVAGTLTVTKAPLTVSAGTYSKKQGDAMPTFKATYSGFKNNETEEVLTKQPVFTTTATEASAPGEYAVNVSGAEATNYSITYEQGKLVVIEKTVSYYYEAEVKTNRGYNLTAGFQTVEITETADNTYTVVYKSLPCYPLLRAVYMGDFTAEGVNGVKDAEGYINYTFDGDATTTNVDVVTSHIGYITEGGTLPFKMVGKSKDGSLVAKFTTKYGEENVVVLYNGYEETTEPDAVVITAKSVTREYGDANPTLEYEVSGGTLDGVPELECTAVQNSPVGTYTITVKSGTVKNNNVTYVSGTLTVTKAPLTISAGTYSKKQGDAMPAFKASYDGFKNNETEEVLTKQPVFTTTATETSEPGEYEVTVSGAEAENYSITYEPGKLVVSASDPEPDPDPEERKDGTVIGTDGYQPAGGSFVWNASIDWETQKLVASIDVSGCNGTNENLLSVGDRVEDWDGNHFHIYYTRNDAGTGGNVLVYYMETYEPTTCATFDMDGDELRIVISKENGITVNEKSFNYKFADYYTNGDPITDTSGFYAALWVLSDIQVGSQEGLNRSNATYNYIRVQDLIKPDVPTAINAAALNGEADIYTLSGVKVNELQKGINIVRMNGKTMKIVKR